MKYGMKIDAAVARTSSSFQVRARTFRAASSRAASRASIPAISAPPIICVMVACADTVLRSAYFEAADSIAPDGDKARRLVAAPHTPALPAETALAAIRTATRIHSDGDQARVLAQAASRLRIPEVDRELRASAETIHSDGDYRRVIAALEGAEPAI
jgi:hypothetical protein